MNAAQRECDHDWEALGDYKICTYEECNLIRVDSDILHSAPFGATHFNRSNTGKLYYFLEFKSTEVEGNNNYLCWYDFNSTWNYLRTGVDKDSLVRLNNE